TTVSSTFGGRGWSRKTKLCSSAASPTTCGSASKTPRRESSRRSKRGRMPRSEAARCGRTTSSPEPSRSGGRRQSPAWYHELFSRASTTDASWWDGHHAALIAFSSGPGPAFWESLRSSFWLAVKLPDRDQYPVPTASHDTISTFDYSQQSQSRSNGTG